MGNKFNAWHFLHGAQKYMHCFPIQVFFKHRNMQDKGEALKTMV